MLQYQHRAPARKYPVRVKFVGLLGFRRRRRWLQPFTTEVYRVERHVLGTWR